MDSKKRKNIDILTQEDKYEFVGFTDTWQNERMKFMKNANIEEQHISKGVGQTKTKKE